MYWWHKVLVYNAPIFDISMNLRPGHLARLHDRHCDSEPVARSNGTVRGGMTYSVEV